MFVIVAVRCKSFLESTSRITSSNSYWWLPMCIMEGHFHASQLQIAALLHRLCRLLLRLLLVTSPKSFITHSLTIANIPDSVSDVLWVYDCENCLADSSSWSNIDEVVNSLRHLFKAGCLPSSLSFHQRLSLALKWQSSTSISRPTVKRWPGEGKRTVSGILRWASKG